MRNKQQKTVASYLQCNSHLPRLELTLTRVSKAP